METVIFFFLQNSLINDSIIYLSSHTYNNRWCMKQTRAHVPILFMRWRINMKLSYSVSLESVHFCQIFSVAFNMVHASSYSAFSPCHRRSFVFDRMINGLRSEAFAFHWYLTLLHRSPWPSVFLSPIQPLSLSVSPLSLITHVQHKPLRNAC